MNCCNAYGQCTQSHGCPCRTTAVPTATTEPLDNPERDFVVCIGRCAMVVIVGLSAIAYFVF